MDEDLRNIEANLRDSKNEWQWHVAKAISVVPSGYLATYGAIAGAVNRQHGLSITARNVAWLRKHFYWLLSHDTRVPLHRIAKVGDINSIYDSETTKTYNDRLRGEEGSLENPRWWQP